MENNAAHNLGYLGWNSCFIILLLDAVFLKNDMCKENRVPRSLLKLFVLQRENKSANTSDTFTGLYNLYHKTGSGLIIDSYIGKLDWCTY